MAKILFSIIDMNIGGVEKALLGFFNTLSVFKHDITLLLANDKGKWLNRVPNNVQIRLIPLTDDERQAVINYGVKNTILRSLSTCKFLTALKIGTKKMLGNNLAALNFNFENLPICEDEYDIAISYHYHNTFITRYVAEKVVAKEKYVWIHNDLSTSKYNYKYTYNYIEKFDKIFCVSKTLCKEFEQAYPKLKDRIELFYNTIDYQKIMLLAEEPQNEIKSGLAILSVGRLDKQKGFDIAIRVAYLLKKRGREFCWYIIGEGEERRNLEKLIRIKNVSDCVKLMGQKNNPYKYMKACDVYVQPSRHEGFCTTTNEIKALGKPIIVTNVAGMNEQFDNGKNGIIVDVDCNKLLEAIDLLLTNDKIRSELKHNVSVSNCDTNMVVRYFKETEAY